MREEMAEREAPPGSGLIEAGTPYPPPRAMSLIGPESLVASPGEESKPYSRSEGVPPPR